METQIIFLLAGLLISLLMVHLSIVRTAIKDIGRLEGQLKVTNQKYDDKINALTEKVELQISQLTRNVDKIAETQSELLDRFLLIIGNKG